MVLATSLGPSTWPAWLDQTSCNLPLALLVMQLSELAQVLHTRSNTETMFNHSVQAVEPVFNSFGAIVRGEPA